MLYFKYSSNLINGRTINAEDVEINIECRNRYKR
jgi:hypothetical protein